MTAIQLVNKNDKIIGYENKEICHKGKGLLHRAFGVFIFNKRGQLLIQKRGEFKKLWPFFWSDACSSHPEKNETNIAAAKRRLKEELGFTCRLKFLGKFRYRADYKKAGAENEICSFFAGTYNGKIKPDKKEIAEIRWINFQDLKRDMNKNPQKYTPWLKIGVKKFKKNLTKLTKPMKSSPKSLNSTLAKYSKMVEPKIAEVLGKNVDVKHQEIVRYPIFTGGKRLRPALTFLTCLLLGGKENDAAYPAAGLEILHNYSLIVDDIIDNSELRRGKATAWRKFGKSIASCIVIDYAAAIFETAAKSKKPIEISDLFSKTLKTIVDGEILDILFERAGRDKEPYIVKNRYKKITEKDFFDMAGKKTAALFGACCEAGGILAGATTKERSALKNYGYNLGLAFQIQDDILDIFGNEKSFGKKIGKDIIERKGGNIIIMLALKNLPQNEKGKILTIMQQNKISAGQVGQIMKYILKTEALQKARAMEEKFINAAKESLNSLPKNKWNKILEEIINFTTTREK